MELNQLNYATRAEFSPFESYVVLCDRLIIAGREYTFGDECPEILTAILKMHHYQNGVIGTKAEKDFLGSPIDLFIDDPTGPVAMFVGNPTFVADKVEEIADSGGDFSMENASLLKTKKDLVGYAKTFGIELKILSSVNMKMMREKLEKLATEKGLLPNKAA